ncbi:MAG: sodium:solute symporter family protein [Nanoarchaeota archaeon]|nr:sodium:solute symporter family protein [Nanoarchaeota archaeon]
MALGTLDLLFIFIYFAVLLFIGYYSSRNQKDEDYLIADRKLGTWQTMMTTNASKTGSILMTFVALVYLWGFSAIWYFIGVVAGALLFIPFAMKVKERVTDKHYTLPHYFKFAYGKKAGFFASLLSIILMFGLLVVNLIAATKLFVFFTGWEFWICAFLVMAVVLLYILMAGFNAVVKTDILQYLAMMLILVLLAVLLFNGSLIPSSEWQIFKADIVTILGFFIVGVMFAFGSPDLWQRVYSAKSKKEVRNGLLISVIIYAIMAFLLALIALTVKVQFPEIDPDLALIHGFANLLPEGLLGLSVVLLFAAIMSSIDTYIFTAGASLIQDFFDWDKRRVVRALRKVIFVLAILATLISIWIQDLIIGSYIFVSFVVVIAIAVLATWIRPSIKEKTLVTEFIFGMIGMIAFVIYGLLSGGITPSLVIGVLGSSLLGLLIGGIISKLTK